jgi:uncharacterized protein
MHPLCNPSFLELLEKSAVINGHSGWQAHHLSLDDALLPGFIKSHSYGEYIFDWQWAELYQRYNRSYYPKLIHALPFTPLNAPKIWNATEAQKQALLELSFEHYQKNERLSGEHYLFIDSALAGQLEKLGFSLMYSLQYHWENERGWQSFQDFLVDLKKNRRKMIQKERRKIEGYELEIRWLTPGEITEALMEQIYSLYLSTINKKGSYAYLNIDFFTLLPHFLKKSLRIIVAQKADRLIAMGLYIQGEKALYGRYWGIDPAVESAYPLLHFELCVYRGLDKCLEDGLALFEAGAQGEHKLWRGFRPQIIQSAHHLRQSEFFAMIKKHLVQYNQSQVKLKQELETMLPYQF